MRTITTDIYSFEELSKEAQTKAIEEVRSSYYEYNNFAENSIDNCYLLEPKHKELIQLFGEDFYKDLNKGTKYIDTPLLKNNRKVYFSLGRDRYIDISNAIEVQDDRYFLLWLGIPEEMHEKVYYSIGKDTIQFEENSAEYEFTCEEVDILTVAVVKFEEHCNDILKMIEADIDFSYTDGAIKEDIEANNIEFLIDGTKY